MRLHLYQKTQDTIWKHSFQHTLKYFHSSIGIFYNNIKKWRRYHSIFINAVDRLSSPLSYSPGLPDIAFDKKLERIITFEIIHFMYSMSTLPYSFFLTGQIYHDQIVILNAVPLQPVFCVRAVLLKPAGYQRVNSVCRNKKRFGIKEKLYIIFTIVILLFGGIGTEDSININTGFRKQIPLKILPMSLE